MFHFEFFVNLNTNIFRFESANNAQVIRLNHLNKVAILIV